MNKEEIRSALNQEISYVNELDKMINTINEAFKSYDEKDIVTIVAKCNYRIANLENAHNFSSVAIQEEIVTNTNQLNEAVNTLNNEIADLKAIKESVKGPFSSDKYNEIANRLIKLIDADLNLSESTIDKANAALNHDFEELENINDKETSVIPEEVTPQTIENALENAPVVEPELNPTEVKVDSLDELANEVDKEIESISETKQDLEETQKELTVEENEPIQVTAVEEAPESTIAPVLMPQEENQSLNDFIANAPVANTEVIQSAASVDEGFVHVDNVEEFGAPIVENEGPTLTRTM